MIGDGWTPLILRDAATGVTTFDDFQESLGISRNTLTQRLNTLVSIGMMTKDAYNDRPKRYRYSLSQMGREFVPVLLAMAAWGDQWMFAGHPPYKFRHLTCGHIAQGQVTCSHCNVALTLETIEVVEP